MAPKTGLQKKPQTRSVSYGRRSFSAGARGSLHVVLTTQSLSGAGGSSPQGSACAIVDELSTTYDLRSHVDMGKVKKAVNNRVTQKKLQSCKNAQKVLELLGLRGVLLLADYGHFNASRFVKGHLWPEELGGPGVEWNLTPMDRSANALWSANFEMKVKKDLQAAEKAEKELKGKHRILVNYRAVVSGKMRPWFTNAAASTKDMLSQLPAKIEGEATIAGFITPDGKATRPPAEVRKAFPGFGHRVSITL